MYFSDKYILSLLSEPIVAANILPGNCQLIVCISFWKDLQKQLDDLRGERHDIEEQSMLIFEENEDRLQTIQQQESVCFAFVISTNIICIIVKRT